MQHTDDEEMPMSRYDSAFPISNGRVVSNTDARFQGKVVLVAIGGSWCPNCHDEAPYLEELYRKYHAAGLEVVGLSFEEGDQLKDPARLRAFITAIRHRVSGAAAGRAGGVERETAAGGESQRLADYVLRGPRWPSARHPHRFRRQSQRRAA